MEPTLLVRLTLNEEYADVHPEIAASDYLSETSVKGWEVITERVFTESEVRTILRDLLAAAEDGPFIPNYDRMDEIVHFYGLSFDPA
jgi:hypothetical protein